MTFDTAKVRKFKMAAKMAYFARKKANFHTILAYNMSFYMLFGSRNTHLELLTSVSVHGWSYMENDVILTKNNLVLT